MAVTGKQLARANLAATFVWIGLIVPTVMWWKDSILWVAVMSLWANIVGHYGAYIAARAERAVEDTQSDVDELQNGGNHST